MKLFNEIKGGVWRIPRRHGKDLKVEDFQLPRAQGEGARAADGMASADGFCLGL